MGLWPAGTASAARRSAGPASGNAAAAAAPHNGTAAPLTTAPRRSARLAGLGSSSGSQSLGGSRNPSAPGGGLQTGAAWAPAAVGEEATASGQGVSAVATVQQAGGSAHGPATGSGRQTHSTSAYGQGPDSPSGGGGAAGGSSSLGKGSPTAGGPAGGPAVLAMPQHADEVGGEQPAAVTTAVAALVAAAAGATAHEAQQQHQEPVSSAHASAVGGHVAAAEGSPPAGTSARTHTLHSAGLGAGPGPETCGTSTAAGDGGGREEHEAQGHVGPGGQWRLGQQLEQQQHQHQPCTPPMARPGNGRPEPYLTAQRAKGAAPSIVTTELLQGERRQQAMHACIWAARSQHTSQSCCSNPHRCFTLATPNHLQTCTVSSIYLHCASHALAVPHCVPSPLAAQRSCPHPAGGMAPHAAMTCALTPWGPMHPRMLLSGQGQGWRTVLVYQEQLEKDPAMPSAHGVMQGHFMVVRRESM